MKRWLGRLALVLFGVVLAAGVGGGVLFATGAFDDGGAATNTKNAPVVVGRGRVPSSPGVRSYYSVRYRINGMIEEWIAPFNYAQTQEPLCYSQARVGSSLPSSCR